MQAHIVVPSLIRRGRLMAGLLATLASDRVFRRRARLRAQPDDLAPIPGTQRRTSLEQNVVAVDLTLSDAELQSLRDAFPVRAAAGQRYPEFQLRKLGI